MGNTGGYEAIHKNLMKQLGGLDISDSAAALGLDLDDSGRAVLPAMGRTFFLNPEGVFLEDGREAPVVLGSVLAGYLIRGATGEPSGNYVAFDSLTELVPAQNSYSNDRLESRFAKYANENPSRLEKVVTKMGGAPGGEVGLGGKSWIIPMLPKIPVQLIFYEGDEEFPAQGRLLVDSHGVRFLEFEYLAVMATLFIDRVINRLAG